MCADTGLECGWWPGCAPGFLPVPSPAHFLSMDATALIEKYCSGDELKRDVQSVVLKTLELLDNYLLARLERGESYVCWYVNYRKGCALCDATCGEYWEEVEGQKMLFCCNICAAAFRNMVEAVKRANKWNGIDSLQITGNNISGRKCVATSSGSDFHYYVKFYNDGRILDFHVL